MNEVTPQERRTAKAVIFGIVYGISGFGLGENIGTSPKEAKKFIDMYLSLYPGVKNYMDLTIKDAYDCGYVRTMFKRKRAIDELFNSNYMVRSAGERIALNTPIQGTAADIMKIAMINVMKELKSRNMKSKIVLQVHDEMMIETALEEVDEVKDILKRKNGKCK